MKINREKSVKINKIIMNKNNLYGAAKKGIIYTMIGIGLFNINSDTNKNEQRLTNSASFYQVELNDNNAFYNHYKELENVINEEYDKDFINYLNNGRLFITDENNQLKEVNLLNVQLVTVFDEEEKTFLIDYSKGNIDVFNNKKCSINNISKITNFEHTNVFYNLYTDNEEQVKDSNTIILNYEQSKALHDNIEKWDGLFHNESPETRAIKNERNSRKR